MFEQRLQIAKICILGCFRFSSHQIVYSVTLYKPIDLSGAIVIHPGVGAAMLKVKTDRPHVSSNILHLKEIAKQLHSCSVDGAFGLREFVKCAYCHRGPSPAVFHRNDVVCSLCQVMGHAECLPEDLFLTPPGSLDVSGRMTKILGEVGLPDGCQSVYTKFLAKLGLPSEPGTEDFRDFCVKSVCCLCRALVGAEPMHLNMSDMAADGYVVDDAEWEAHVQALQTLKTGKLRAEAVQPRAAAGSCAAGRAASTGCAAHVVGVSSAAGGT